MPLPCPRPTLSLIPLLAALAASGSVQAADSAPAWVPPPAIEAGMPQGSPAWRLPGVEFASNGARLVFQGLPAMRIEALRHYNREPGAKPMQVGIGRETSSEAEPGTRTDVDLQWSTVADGVVARIEITSPGARGLRSGLRVDGLPASAELRVAGSALPDLVLAAPGSDLASLLDDSGLYWSDVTDGERQWLELFLPHGSDASAVSLRVEAISHLLAGFNAGDNDLQSIGDSGSCQIDVVCRYNSLGQEFVNTKNAVARFTFQRGSSSYSCTGTLLNDLDNNTVIPWFITAQHCIGTAGEASTVRTFWNFETPTCNVDNAGPNIQVTGGAQLAVALVGNDAALARLNASPPAGAVYAGWSSATLAAGNTVMAVHHPSADIKKVSHGTHTGVTASVSIGGATRSDMLRVRWTEASTEGGSSGSGLFTSGSSGYQLRGMLSGGAASCSNSGQSEEAGNRDYYANFAGIYPSLRPMLNPNAPVNGPTRNYTGNWYQPSESGRGISLYQYDDGSLLGLWFVYDSQGRASWYQLDPAWTGPDLSSGRVVRWSGPAWGPTYLGTRTWVEVGTYSLQFTSASQATLTYNVDGVARSVTLFKLGA